MARWLMVAFGCAAVWQTTAAEPGTSRVSTTVYVGKHFEVRDHDQPVKYVWEGSTRVARITGSLASNARLQRLRLWPGWNLVSLAVTAENLAEQIARQGTGPTPVVGALYRIAANGYQSVEAGETVPAGSGLWIKASARTLIGIAGEYSEPEARAVPAGGAHVGGSGLEMWPLEPPSGATVWRFDAARQRWQAALPGELTTVADLAPVLAPGEAVYVQTDAPIVLEAPDPEARISYYHQDHLGSASVVTDAAGEVARETAYYPMGTARHEERFRPVESHYGFTQKERDAESRLHYFEARYLSGTSGRFITVDPRLSQHRFSSEAAAGDFFANPQRLNHYAYAVNNPLRFIDPKGEDIAKPRKSGKAPESAKGTTLELRGIDGGGESKNLDVTTVSLPRAGRQRVGAAASRDVDDPGGEVVIVSGQGRHTSQLAQMAVQGANIREATIIVRVPDPAQGGKERELYRLKLTDVMISSFTMSAGVDKPMDQFTLAARKIEFEQIPAPTGPVPIPYPMRLFLDLATPRP